MVTLGEEALRHVVELRCHYERLERHEATRNLLLAIDRARARIGRSPATGASAPRPYPGLVKQGRLWIKEGRYWFAYITTEPPIIIGIFFETADLPTRAATPP